MSEVSPLAAPVNEFTLTLLQRLTTGGSGAAAAKPLEESVFASPFSVSTALAMLALGSRGESLRQLTQGLALQRLEASDDSNPSAHPAHKHFKEVSHSIPLLLNQQLTIPCLGS